MGPWVFLYGFFMKKNKVPGTGTVIFIEMRSI